MSCLRPSSCQIALAIMLSSAMYLPNAFSPRSVDGFGVSPVWGLREPSSLSTSERRYRLDFPMTQESRARVFKAMYILAWVVLRNASSTFAPRVEALTVANGTWWTSATLLPDFGIAVRTSMARERAPGEMVMFESRTQRMSCFASRYGRMRLLTLGLTPTTSSPAPHRWSTIHEGIWRAWHVPMTTRALELGYFPKRAWTTGRA